MFHDEAIKLEMDQLIQQRKKIEDEIIKEDSYLKSV